jgi:hypothetical protein
MDRVFQKKLIEKLGEMVRCSEAMNCILKEQEAALETDDPDDLLRAINDMDECLCQLLDLDRGLSELRASTALSKQAIEAPEVEELMARASSLQEENTSLMLSNRDLIDTKMAYAPPELRELLEERAIGFFPPEDFPPFRLDDAPEQS